jgi:hypothetical protein
VPGGAKVAWAGVGLLRGEVGGGEGEGRAREGLDEREVERRPARRELSRGAQRARHALRRKPARARAPVLRRAWRGRGGRRRGGSDGGGGKVGEEGRVAEVEPRGSEQKHRCVPRADPRRRVRLHGRAHGAQRARVARARAGEGVEEQRRILHRHSQRV